MGSIIKRTSECRGHERREGYATGRKKYTSNLFCFDPARRKNHMHRVQHIAHLSALQRTFAQQQLVQVRQLVVRHCGVQVVLQMVVNMVREQHKA